MANLVTKDIVYADGIAVILKCVSVTSTPTIKALTGFDGSLLRSTTSPGVATPW